MNPNAQIQLGVWNARIVVTMLQNVHKLDVTIVSSGVTFILSVQIHRGVRVARKMVTHWESAPSQPIAPIVGEKVTPSPAVLVNLVHQNVSGADPLTTTLWSAPLTLRGAETAGRKDTPSLSVLNLCE